MMKNSLVSILIPAYNAEKTIKNCIECAVNQTYTNIEIVIVDDCSTDNTVKIVNSFNDSRIKLYKNETNLGMSNNWNRCIEKSNGEFIHFLHGDDIIKENCIEEKMKIIEKDNDINLVFSPTEIIDNNNRIIMKRKYLINKTILDGKKFSKKSFRIANLFGEPSNVLFRKSVLDKTGMFSNTKYSTDWEMWIKIASIEKIGYINKYLTQYRISPTNLTSSFNLMDIIEDDKKMINNLKNIKYIDINTFDVLIHKINIFTRTVARRLYLVIIN